MKINVRFTVYINEANVPSEFLDQEYFEEIIRENVEDVFLGAGIEKIDIENVTVDNQDYD